jgi:hypothetical protein
MRKPLPEIAKHCSRGHEVLKTGRLSTLQRSQTMPGGLELSMSLSFGALMAYTYVSMYSSASVCLSAAIAIAPMCLCCVWLGLLRMKVARKVKGCYNISTRQVHPQLW